MIPNVSRNTDATVLTTYLVGPGRTDEHLEPHLVGGSPHLRAWYSDATLSHEDGLDLGAELNQAHRLLGVDVTGGHIWHCSLSLHDQDGVRTDEEWDAIAEDFMREMGFVGVEGKEDVTWAAVRHGLSGQNGNDHIHIAASLVRPDGTRADVWRDYPRSQEASRVIEAKYRLLPIIPGHGARGYTKGEVEVAQRRGRPEPERVTLARMVRGYATASDSEAEFVRRCRRGGLLLRPSFGDQEMGTVRGYAAALKPPPGFKPMYTPGWKIAGDLGLGVLRQGWQTGEDAESVEEWRAAKLGRRIVVTDGRDAGEVDPASLDRVADQLADLRAKLRSVPFEDTARWREVAAFVSGAYASWSVATEPEPGPLARVSDELARSAQVSRSAYRGPSGSGGMGMYSATALALAAHTSGPGAHLAMFVHMSKLAKTVHEFNHARGDRVRELALKNVAVTDLERVSDALHDAAGVTRPKGKTSRPRDEKMGSVIGPDLTARQTTGRKASR